MKYKVTVNDDTYIAEVECLDESVSNEEKKNYAQETTGSSGAEVAFEVSKNEYEHSFQRSEKLDNKIYILLTVCAFFFVLLSDLIKGIGDIEYPRTQAALVLVIVFSIILFLSVFLFVLMLVWLVKLLKGIELKRIDGYEVVGKNMANASINQVVGYVAMRYEQCCASNNNAIEKRFKAFNKCVTLLVVNAIFLLVLAFVRNYI